MKKVTIKAYNGRGENKVFVGEEEVEKPENLADAIELTGEDDLVKGWWSSYVIEVQNRIRTGGTTSLKSKTDKIVATARTRKANGDNSLYELCMSTGLISE